MKRVLFLSALILSGCNNSAENKKNFDACVKQAEDKYELALYSICLTQPWSKPGQCSFNVESNNALLRSKDNEISACAVMYAPK